MGGRPYSPTERRNSLLNFGFLPLGEWSKSTLHPRTTTNGQMIWVYIQAQIKTVYTALLSLTSKDQGTPVYFAVLKFERAKPGIPLKRCGGASDYATNGSRIRRMRVALCVPARPPRPTKDSPNSVRISDSFFLSLCRASFKLHRNLQIKQSGKLKPIFQSRFIPCRESV